MILVLQTVKHILLERLQRHRKLKLWLWKILCERIQLLWIHYEFLANIFNDDFRRPSMILYFSTYIHDSAPVVQRTNYDTPTRRLMAILVWQRYPQGGITLDTQCRMREASHISLDRAIKKEKEGVLMEDDPLYPKESNTLRDLINTFLPFYKTILCSSLDDDIVRHDETSERLA